VSREDFDRAVNLAFLLGMVTGASIAIFALWAVR